MLPQDVKDTIQSAYSQFLNKNQLTARYGQKLMIADIARTLSAITTDTDGQRQSNNHIAILEAGTGTGKTIAYLLSVIPIAQALGKKVVISTATVALQEQIVHKDLPEVKRHTDLSFNFILAKGRGRYLCLSKLDRLLMDIEGYNEMHRTLYQEEHYQEGNTAIDGSAITVYNAMVDALSAGNWNGDRDDWPQEIDSTVWSAVTATHLECTRKRCSNPSSCPSLKSREAIDSYDCIVANHDLVLADLALGGGAILPNPKETIYIFDEGHHLPDKALGHFAFHTRVGSTAKWLDQNHKVLSSMLGDISGAGQVDHYAEQLPALLLETKQTLDLIYPLCQQYLEQSEEDSDRKYRNDSQRYRFENGVVDPIFSDYAQQLADQFSQLLKIIDHVVDEVQQALDDGYCSVPRVELEKWLTAVSNWQARTEANMQLWRTYQYADENKKIPQARWITLVDFGGTIDFEVCSSPILAADTLRYSLWNECYAAVVTSATLTALGRFDRFCMRAGTSDEHFYNVMPSPFDFSNARLQVPEFAVEANDDFAHTRSIIDHLPNLLDEKQGSLVLFSSRKQMQDVYEELPMHWQEKILMQGDHSKQEMLNQHKQQIDNKQGSVLFGLASFAEGVDLPGDYCSHVIVAKLPFSVPDDPVEASLAEWIEARGGNPFMEIAVPDASIKLVQACGRLLRKENDKGLISILDKRLETKRYGKVLLNSLPPYSR